MSSYPPTSAQPHASRPNSAQPTASRPGSVLLMVLIVISVLSLCTASYLLLMQNEHRATRYYGWQRQAAQAAASGVVLVQELLTLSPTDISSLGGLYDNPQELRAVQLTAEDDPQDAWLTTLIAPRLVEGYYSGYRNGVQNESAKLHLNAVLADDPEVQRSRLLAIPGVNVELADSILDWLDADDSPREYGAESEYYEQLSPHFQASNGAITRLDQLLAVRGMTPELLYGVDQNRNYAVDYGEQPRGALREYDNSRGQLNHGIAAYVTVTSAEKLVGEDGPLINVNNPSLQLLQTSLQQVLTEEQVNFIILYRQFGGQVPAEETRENRDQDAEGNSNAATVKASAITLDLTKPANSTLNSLLDLIGSTVTVPGDKKKKEQSQQVASPWADSPEAYRELGLLYESATVSDTPAIAGRININTASRPVLMSVPGMSPAVADQILQLREPGVDPAYSEQRTIVWLLTNQLASLEELKSWEKYITTSGCVFSGQSIGFRVIRNADDEARLGSWARQQFILDARGEQPEWIAWEDLTSLGRGFSQEALTGEAAPTASSP